MNETEGLYCTETVQFASMEVTKTHFESSRRSVGCRGVSCRGAVAVIVRNADAVLRARAAAEEAEQR